MPALGKKINGFVGINRYIPVFQGPLNTPYLHAFFDEAKKRLLKVDPSGPLPDRYVQSNYEALNALKQAMIASKFDGRADTPKLIDALEGMEMKEGHDFPQGDKTLRKADHQAFLREFLFEDRERRLQSSRDGAEGSKPSSHRPARSLHKCALNARRNFDERAPRSMAGELQRRHSSRPSCCPSSSADWRRFPK